MAARTLMDRATEKYPYLKDKDIAFVSKPEANPRAFLESWPPGEEGSKDWYLRPKEIPMDKFGVQIMNEKTDEKGILADYVSHWATNPNNPKADKRLTDLYQRFSKTLDRSKLMEQYRWAQGNANEKRPFEKWAEQSGIPAAFRGYTFDQWPKEFNDKYYSPESRKILDEVRKHVGVN